MKNLKAAAVMAGLVAGVLAMAAPVKAQAQQFSFGVNVGAPVYGYRDGYDRERYEDYYRQQAYLQQQAYARQQAWARHEEWERHERHEAWEHQDWDRHDGDHRDGDRH